MTDAEREAGMARREARAQRRHEARMARHEAWMARQRRRDEKLSQRMGADKARARAGVTLNEVVALALLVGVGVAIGGEDAD